MKYIKPVTMICLLLVPFSLIACGAERTQQPDTVVTDGDERLANFKASYADVPIDEQIEQADIIFAGTVTNISKTLWNQDSGEYWEEEIEGITHRALPYYTIELKVSRPIFNAQEGETVVVTQVGISPLEKQVQGTEYGIAGLQVGSKVVIFVRHAEMGWRDGKKPILGLMSGPTRSYFLRGDDGLYRTAQARMMRKLGRTPSLGGLSLDEVIAYIAQRRAIQE